MDNLRLLLHTIFLIIGSRDNIRLNEHFRGVPPNLGSFVPIIKKEFKYYSGCLKIIRNNSSEISYCQGIYEKHELTVLSNPCSTIEGRPNSSGYLNF
ncbi:hypothetical protein HZS_4395 [Henneguya salminicola]|nr:hypothetical protein HZS_4395 [Henneguya salminicola]